MPFHADAFSATAAAATCRCRHYVDSPDAIVRHRWLLPLSSEIRRFSLRYATYGAIHAYDCCRFLMPIF